MEGVYAAKEKELHGALWLEEPTGAEHKHAWDTSSLCRQALSTRSEAGAEAEAG